VNGRALKKDTDYTIDYNFGRITLLSPEATDPNGEISVDYEYAPFLAVQKKTLLGMRAEYDWSQDFQIGSTVLYKSDQAQQRKPRVGQETSKMVVYDVDATLKVQPSFVTKALDALPFYQTEAASGMTISGELAQSHPNPNVEGSAYVDDFESALEQLSLGVNRTTWQPASLPKHIDADSYLRGKVLWHQPRDAVSTTDVYDVKTGRGEGSIRTLRMVFRPHHDSVAVAYNADTTALVYDTLPGSYHSWGGIMRYFHNRVDASRVQLFEVRMRGSKRGRLHFDFGRINEDANGNDRIDSEDILSRNGSVEEEEDTGLDNLMDDQEPFYIDSVNTDPSDDNWYFLGEGKCPLPAGSCDGINWDDESIRYEWLNGTEGNIGDISVLGYPDREQLNTSGFNESDAYFSFAIDLADDAQFLVEGSEKPAGAENPWRTYRIPVLDTLAQDAVVSTDQIVPNWANISHVRVWFDDTTDSTLADTIEIADWYFVQSNWRDSIDVHDRSRELTESQQTKFVVASVSEEDGTFSPHPDVEAYKDPATGLTEPQRALLMSFQDLNHFDTCLAIKELLEVDKYSGYRRMEMYVHGGTGITLDPNGQQPIGLFMRLGQDSANFYEVRNDVYPGWDQRNNVDIDFNELTAVKDSLIRDAAKGEERNIDGTSGRYRVKGAPNLNEVRYFVVGVVNHDIVDTVGGATADIWLDELRVSDVRKDVGTAARISVNGTLADLLNYGFGYQTMDPYFRQVSSATRGGGDNNLGSGKTQTNYNYNLTFNLDRFTPKSWGMRLPISYSYAKSTTIPLLRTSSDIVLPDEVRELEKSVSESRNFSVSENFNYRGKNPLFTVLLNRQNASVSYRRSVSTSPTTPYQFGENITVKGGLDLGISSAPTLPIFFWTQPIPVARKAAKSRLGLYPVKWTLSGDYARSASITDDINLNRRSSLKRDFGASMDVTYKLFENIALNYRVTTRRDLSDLNLVNLSLRNLRLGLETSYSQSFSTGYNPKLLSWFTTDFDYKANYSDDYDRSSKSRNGRMTRNWGLKGTFDHHKLFGGKASGGDRQYRGRRGKTKAAGEQEEKPKGRPFYDYPRAGLRWLTGWIKAPTYSYNESYNIQMPGMLQRPSWRHRFGLDDLPQVDTVKQSRAPSSSEGFGYSGSSGFIFLGGLAVDFKYSRSVSRDLITRGSRYEKRDTNWPDLTIRIDQFTTLPLIKGVVNKLISVFQPRTGYNRSTRETRDLDVGHITARSTSTNYNPLISFNFNILKKLSLTTKYSRSEDESENFNLSTGDIEKLTRSEKKSLDFQTGYSFSAPGGIGIPLFGKLKFTSQMSVQFDVGFNSALSETSTRGGPFVVSSDKSDFTWAASLKYSFSQQVNGGLTARWQDSNDETRNRLSHVRELSIWAELRF
jgi:cell surface protein SprA